MISLSLFHSQTRMHSSRMPTVRFSCRPSCTHAPCHTCPSAMHTPTVHTPAMHAPNSPTMHIPCHTCPLPCMFPATHASLSPAMHAPFHTCPLPYTHPSDWTSTCLDGNQMSNFCLLKKVSLKTSVAKTPCPNSVLSKLKCSSFWLVVLVFHFKF